MANNKIDRINKEIAKARDWAVFAKCYNGPAYAQNRYDVKLEAAYQKYSL